MNAYGGSDEDAKDFASGGFGFWIQNGELGTNDYSMDSSSLHYNLPTIHLSQPESHGVTAARLRIEKGALLVRPFTLRILIDLLRQEVKQIRIRAPVQVNSIEKDDKITRKEATRLSLDGDSLIRILFLTAGGEEDMRGHIFVHEPSGDESLLGKFSLR